MKIDISSALGNDAVAKDIRATVRYALETRGTKVRLVYVPHEIMIKACETVAKGLFMQPFIPTIEGIPCQFSPTGEVSVACVADDDTNFERTINREVAPQH